MVRGRVLAYGDRVRSALEEAFAEDHPPNDVAASFAVGLFVTSLPTLGTGLLVFVALAALFDRISKLALLASVVVLNPVVKWGVYAVSFWLGVQFLGPVSGVTPSDISFSAGPEIVARLLVGNLILSVIFTLVGYVLALRVVRSIRERDLDLDLDTVLSDADKAE